MTIGVILYPTRPVASSVGRLLLAQIRNVIGSHSSVESGVLKSRPRLVHIRLESRRSFHLATIDKMSEQDKSDLRERLTPLQYQVTQEKGTERAFTGKYDKFYESGTYSCIVCGQYLFSSDTKYDSGCGWPAFNDVLDNKLVKLSKDTSHVGANLLLLINNPGRIRTEVQCAKCDAHLGHVFDDGPLPTKKRFCINSASLEFHPKQDE